MFLVTVTPSGEPQPDIEGPAHVVAADPFVIRVVTDGFLSSCATSEEGFTLVESPLTGCGDTQVVRSVTIQYTGSARTLTITKTTVGGRPLYYHFGPTGAFFCSTHIGMLAAAGVRLEENREVLPEYFVYRIVMPPQTMFRGVLDLPPGSRLEVTVASSGCRPTALQDFDPPAPQSDMEVAAAAERTVALLRRGLGSLAGAHARTAVLLSGGIDSSILHLETTRAFGPTESYSTEYPFDDPALTRERTYALSAAAALHAQHHHFEMSTARYLRALIQAVAAAEIPVHHLQSVCIHALCGDGIRRERDVVLIGLGAGGSYGNFRNFLARKDDALFRIAMRQPVRGLLQLASSATGKGKNLVESIEQAARAETFSSVSSAQYPLWDWHAYGDPAWVCDYLGVTADEIIRWPRRAMERLAARPIEDVWALYSLLGDEAVSQYIWSKIGEANGKRVYYPYYDDGILAFLFSISWKTKLARPENALRREMARQVGVPAFIRNRPKSGFGIKRRGWAERGGVFEPIVPLAAKVVGEASIRALQSSEGKRPTLFWNLLNYGLWKRICIDREHPSDLIAELDIPAEREEEGHSR